MLIGRVYRLVWVYTCQNATLLEITCRGSNGSRLCEDAVLMYIKDTQLFS